MKPGILIRGVVRYIKRSEKVTRFKLQVFRGRNAREGEQKHFFIVVKMFGESDAVFNNSRVWINGILDGHHYNGQDIIEILCNAQDVLIDSPVRIAPGLPPGYPLPPDYEDEEERNDLM